MKILHTADWHIGKIVNEYSMIEDQEYILNKLFELIETKEPDVLIISGDIYDRSIPPKEAVELLDNTFTKLIEKYNLPTLLISGNHDSCERLSFGSKLLEAKNLYIQGNLSENIKKVVLNDSYGVVNFYLVPYANPMIVRNLFKDDKITDHNSAMEAIINKIKHNLNLEERNILVTHNYVINIGDDLKESESERTLSVGGADFVDVSLVKDFDYVALGHLHKPQKVKVDKISYPGSILKYSFSESSYQKGVKIINLKEKGNFDCQFVALQPKRDMLILKGKLTELTDKAYYQKINCDDYICAILTDNTDLYDPISSLRAIYPNIMQIQRNNLITNIDSNTKASKNFKDKSMNELFTEFYHNIVSNDLDDVKQDLVMKVIAQIHKEGGE